jgi:Arc/MetJ family transcription regulator
MSRTNIELDDELVEAVMQRYHFKTKREAVNYALQAVRDEAFSPEQIKALRGTGFWDGDPAAAGLDPVEFPELFGEHSRTA